VISVPTCIPLWAAAATGKSTRFPFDEASDDKLPLNLNLQALRVQEVENQMLPFRGSWAGEIHHKRHHLGVDIT
jgi:stringent starvation protein B